MSEKSKACGDDQRLHTDALRTLCGVQCPQACLSQVVLIEDRSTAAHKHAYTQALDTAGFSPSAQLSLSVPEIPHSALFHMIPMQGGSPVHRTRHRLAPR